MSRPALNRRRFFELTAAAGVAAGLPASVRRGPVRRETLRVACIGVGGMGRSDLDSIATAPDVEIAALCDVDATRLGEAAKAHPDAATFADFRRLLDEHGKDLHGVVVSTPDHMHGPIALAAMARDLHVYCQKPIAHNLFECRRMAQVAAARGLVTQMGTQIHAHAAYQTAIATLQHGVLGKVRRAHLWVSKSWAGPAAGRPDRSDPVPETLDWDLWLGVAAERPYVQGAYHPAQWRGWRDFGGGTLGDMGCHIFDPVFSALELGPPRTAVSRGPEHREETFAGNGDVTYTFASTRFTDGELELRWTDGSARPHRKDDEDLVRHLPDVPEHALPGGGSFLVCENGVMVIPHWSMPRFYADGEAVEVEVQERPSGNHYHEWAAACRGEGRASTAFEYSGPLTEAVLLGTLAGCFPETTLTWDGERATIDHEPAQALVRREYREGWELA